MKTIISVTAESPNGIKLPNGNTIETHFHETQTMADKDALEALHNGLKVLMVCNIPLLP